jgi:DNA-binding transcriptional MerR regulator
MSENGTDTLEQAIEGMPQANKDALPAIERRIEALAGQRQQIAQQLARLTREDAACEGAIVTLRALQEELQADD